MIHNSRHPTHESARVLVLDQRQPNADVAAISFGTGKILGDFIETNVTMADLDQKLQWTLQPNVQAPDTRCFDDHPVIEVSQCGILQPSHQKSSAEGIRLYAILPPA